LDRTDCATDCGHNLASTSLVALRFGAHGDELFFGAEDSVRHNPISLTCNQFETDGGRKLYKRLANEEAATGAQEES
jgi:hypothetical protein